MHKIYSRPRLRIPKIIMHTKKQNIKSKKRVSIVFILIIAFATLKLIINAILPIFNELCREKAISIATIISNNKATEVMENHSYDELFVVEKDTNGDITMIKSNVVPINQIISDVAVKIQEEINNTRKEDVEIALRKYYGI